MCIRDRWSDVDIGECGLGAAVGRSESHQRLTSATDVYKRQVIAYNLVGSSIREFAARSDDFTLEVLNAIESMQPQPVAEVRR